VTVRQQITERRQRKQSAVDRLCTEGAFLGALVFHVALFYAFRIPPSSTNHTLPVTQPDATLIAPLRTGTSLTGAAAALEKTIHAWCVLADPTLMSLPNDTVGFGLVRQNERALPVTEVPPYGYDVTPAAERPFPPVALTAPLPALDSEVAAKWTVADVRERPPTPVPNLPRQLIWRYTDGTLLTDVPKLDPAEIREAVTQTGVPQQPTRLQIHRADASGPVAVGQRESFSRLRLRRSCGNARLDQLLVTALKRELLQLELQQKFRHEVTERPYFPTPGGTLTFEVEWRLMPTVSETPQESVPANDNG